MGFHINKPQMKERRQELRNKSTEAEKLIWNLVRNNRLGCKFYRQYSFDNYVVDFYCPKNKLAIEIDGGIHKKNQKYDEYRTKYLNAFNIKVIRFSNETVIKNPDRLALIFRGV